MRGGCSKGYPTNTVKRDLKTASRASRRGLQKEPRGTSGDVLLIAMPWQTVLRPSIQLGTLQSTLERAGIRTEALSLGLTFVEHLLAETAHRPEGEQIRLPDYEAVADLRYTMGLGEWIFAVPPFREARETNDPYLAYFRSRGIPELEVAKALTMRALVPSFLQRCLNLILPMAPRVVGFTSTFSQNVPSLVLAKLLKQHHPAVQIVFGGGNCDGPMGAALQRAFPWVDVVVRGEGDRVLPALVRDLLAGRPVRPQPGLCYKEGEHSIAIEQGPSVQTPMDEVPTPTFDEYFERLEKTSFRSAIMGEVRIPYESARGCWWGAKSHCTFCGLNGTSMAFRSKHPTRVVEDLIALARQYGRLDFLIVDNIMDLRYLREVLPPIRETGYDFSLFYEMKANLTREQVRLLREAGVDFIQPGLESLSTPILRLMRKGVTAFQNVRLLKWCAQYGIDVSWNVIYGLPGEPPEEYATMAEAVPSLTHLQPPTLCPLWVERFSPYFERPEDFGLELLGPVPWYPLIYDVEPATLAELAYAFEYRYADGRNPENYIEPLRRAIESWNANSEAGFRSLRYRRGPGFLAIRDRRPNLDAADYSFGEREARLYLACEDGATPADVSQALRSGGIADVTPDQAREYLDALTAMRLVYKEGGRYLALALPTTLPEAAEKK